MREVRVSGNDHESIDRRLGGQEAIERIAMRRRHQPGSTHARHRDRQDLEPSVVHVALEIEEQVAGLGPLAETDFDGDLPCTRHTDQNVVLIGLQS